MEQLNGNQANSPNMGLPTWSYSMVYGANRQMMNEFPTPPGYRFVPTDEELLTNYLKNKILDKPLPATDIINDVNIYKFSPEQLSEKYKLNGEKMMYFFTPRDRKYPRGDRPNRLAVDGFWKATGAEIPIGNPKNPIGYRRPLVFNEGNPREPTKTNWIMHEYTIALKGTPSTSKAPKPKALDEWVLCKMYKNEQNIENQPALNIVPPEENQPPPSIVAHGELPNSVQKPQSNQDRSLFKGYNTNDFPISNCNGQINGYDLHNGSHIIPPPVNNTNDSTMYNCNGQINGSDCGDHKYSQDLSTGLVHDSESLFIYGWMQDFPGVPAQMTEFEVPLPDYDFSSSDGFFDYPELHDSVPDDKAQQVP